MADSSVADVHDQMKKALQLELLSVNSQKYLSTHLSPILRDQEKHFEDLYVAPNMKVIENPRTVNDDGIQIKSFQDIFKSGSKDIYVVGDAGAGKSSLCQEMVSTWCQINTNKTENMSKSQTAMAKFDYLFCISLRQAINEDTIDEMIKHHLLSNKENLHEVLYRVLEEENCLVIIDGLDEWTTNNKTTSSAKVNRGLPGRDALQNCTVITTTRPWTFESIKLQSTQIYTKVELFGIDGTSSEKLIQIIIKNLNENFHSQITYDDFISEISDKGLDELITIPVILKQIVCLTYSGKKLGKSKSVIYGQILELLFELAQSRLIKDDSKFQQENENWKKSSIKLPRCFDENEKFQAFKPLLFALAKFAFLTLLSGDQESSLIFKSTETGCHNLSPEEVNVCLKIGILSQHKISIDSTSQHTQILFLHKTYQEYLAAMFVSLNQSDVKQYINTIQQFCSTEDKCKEISNVLSFISGVCTSDITCTLLDHYHTKIFDSQSVIMNCLREGWSCSHENKHLYCDRINITEPSEYLDLLCRVNIPNIKTLVIHSPPTAQCLKNLLEVQKLDRLEILQKISSPISEYTLYDLVNRHKHTLTITMIEGMTLRSKTKLSNILQEAPRLHYVLIYGATMPRELLESLCALHSVTENRMVIVTQPTVLSDKEALHGSTMEALNETKTTTPSEVEVTSLPICSTDSDVKEEKVFQGSTMEALNETERTTQTEVEVTSLPMCSTDSDVKEGKAYSLPVEILRMGRQSIELYKQILTEGKEAVHTIRVMVVGQFDVGKTALTRRLLNKHVDIDKRDSTNGIEVHIKRCKVCLKDGEWTVLEQDDKSENSFKRLVKLIAQHKLNMQEDKTERESNVDRIPFNTNDVPHKEDKTPTPDVDTIQPKVSDDQCIDTEQDNSRSMNPQVSTYSSDTDHHDTDTNIPTNEDTIFEDIKGVIQEANNLKDTQSNYADLSIWDFAGQYAFYATHQVFLSWRAVYLLVTDISKPLQDVVEEDKCYLDSTGSKLCSISEFIEFWLNSIHEYCSNQEPGVPPVILVGTHADILDQSKKEELSDQYFDGLRELLMDKVTFSHLVDADFTIDNSIVDPNLTKLKDKIIEVASKQQYWGELIPARWITLEKALVELRVEGLKVCEIQTLLTINKELPVPLSSDEEMDLFLRFHHDSGNILYFCHEDICDDILLDPQWLVDAFKCLITANTFLKKKPGYKQWLEFDRTGKLKQELIDVVWKDTEFSAHRNYLLRLLERLDIIARPRSFVTNDMQSKIEDYFFAPCILKDPPPKEIFQPNTSTTAISTSRLCYSMSNKALPVAMFNRLMAACLTKWPVSKQGRKDLIFCGCGSFDVDRRHRLTILFSQDVIQIWVTKFADLKRNDDVCMKVRKIIEAALTKILKQMPATGDLKTSFKCPDITNVRSNDGMFDLEDFLNNEYVPCHFHDQTHNLRSADVLKYWNFEEACHEDEISEEIWKQVLRKNYPKFVSDMEPKSVIDQFHELQFLPSETLRDIGEKSTTSEKNRAILDTVLTKGSKGYEDFKECLRKTEQACLVSQLLDVENQLLQGMKKQRMEIDTVDDYDSKTINGICHRYGRKSKQLLTRCEQVSIEIKSVSPLIQCVWPGYRLSEPEKVVFVVFTEHREQVELPSHFQTLDIKFDLKSPSSEDKDIMSSENLKRKRFTDDELKDLGDTIENKTGELLDKHERLSIISACPLKSKRYGTHEAEIVDQTCIVLSVRVKGIIPLKEEPFPKEIFGFPTDVREGSFAFFGKSPKDYHETLKVGCQISNKCIGTLGPFVLDTHNNICSITSAHVLLSDHEYKCLQGLGNKDYTTDTVEAYQPLPSAANSKFGRVSKGVIKSGGKGEAGVEVVLVQIMDVGKIPNSIMFPDFPMENIQAAGFESFPTFTGRSYNGRERGFVYYKFGCETNITRGMLYFPAAIAKLDTFPYTQLHNQIQILSDCSQPFAKHGDSGSLVATAYNGKLTDLRAIGIVTGGVPTYDIVFVTPMKDILTALDCSLHDFQEVMDLL